MPRSIPYLYQNYTAPLPDPYGTYTNSILHLYQIYTTLILTLCCTELSPPLARIYVTLCQNCTAPHHILLQAGLLGPSFSASTLLKGPQ